MLNTFVNFFFINTGLYCFTIARKKYKRLLIPDNKF